MSEYIERETLLKHTIALNNPHELGENVVPVSDIEAAPAADVAEVVHGRWIRGGANDMHGFDFHCSECNKSFHLGSLATIYDVEREWPYCPNCGAKMDKEDET